MSAAPTGAPPPRVATQPAFPSIARAAKRWLTAHPPSDAALDALVNAAHGATRDVPEARRGDWAKLLAGFAKTEPSPRRRARVEALGRACKLFSRALRDSAPLDWEDATDRAAGIGPAARDALAAAGVTTVADLVWTLPVAWDDLREPLSVEGAVKLADDGGRTARVCVGGVVRSASMVPMRGRRAVRVVVSDADAPKPTLHAWWFFEAHGVLSVAKVGAAVLLVGRVVSGAPRPAKMAHPDLILDVPAARVAKGRYPRLGVSEGSLRKAIGGALARVGELPDPVPHAIATREGMSDASRELRAAHGLGDGAPSVEGARALRERLAWVEAFAHVRARLAVEREAGEGRGVPTDRATHARLVAELGFPLTNAQKRAIDAVLHDLARKVPMRRLVLGDVGSGKTAVALAAAAQCARAKLQVAILAPTSVLAEQTLDAAAPLARATGAAIALVTGDVPAAQRARAVRGIARGDIDVVIGTHALLSDDVAFARLGLVIVDEQHRLGVGQRVALVKKGERPHLLTLSATPIPRTLALALRGELATSTLDERPRGRLPVKTEVRRRRRDLDDVVREIKACVARGERAFFIVPRIDDDDEDGIEARARELSARLSPAKVAVVHGGMSGDDKRAAMRAFRRGDAQVLVGTTVVEVGVDVPEATLLVVEGAERFGLAQLHQLRGRVGRSERASCCVLLYDEPLSDTARARLDAIAQTNDGAEIARLDLALRGAGDLGGTRQSGDGQELSFLDLAAPPPWLERIEEDARALLRDDPELGLPEHRALRIAVRRFSHVLALRQEAG